jgi:hypothetical protein
VRQSVTWTTATWRPYALPRVAARPAALFVSGSKEIGEEKLKNANFADTIKGKFTRKTPNKFKNYLLTSPKIKNYR